MLAAAAIPLLRELTLIAAIGVLVTVLLGRLRLPTVAGLLLAGALLGPHAMGLVGDLKEIEALADVGVVLLLFTIGLEFPLTRMRHIFRRVALGGIIQVFGTGALVVIGARAFGFAPPTALLFGFVIALSSTAIVLRALDERGELDAPHGRFIVGTLLFQDLCVVPMVLLVPVLAAGGGAGDMFGAVGKALGNAALIVTGALLLARVAVPRVLRWVDASRSREVFLLAVLTFCIGTAWLTAFAGLSVALGAFLGGMVVAGTEYQHRALGDIIPLRDAFLSVFFVSLGMLFDVRILFERPLAVGGLFLALLLGKALVVFVAALAMRFPARAAWLAGVGLAQFGEFGFVLLRAGEGGGLVGAESVRLLLASGILTMFLTPILIRAAPHLSAGERLLAPLARLMRTRGIEEIAPEEPPRGHVVLIGYGVVGRTVARALTACGTRHVVLELNADTVRRARAEGEPVYFADATSVEALRHARVESAAAAVVVINDPRALLRIIAALRRCAPALPVLARTRYASERGTLRELGAEIVVADEVEASFAVLGRTLERLGEGPEEVAAEVAAAREALREPAG